MMWSTLHINEDGTTCRIDSENEYVPVQTPNGEAQVNRWHTKGLGETPTIDPLCQLAREKLPQKSLPIYVGNTGYINLNHRISEFPNGWCVDDLNRTVFIFNNILYFQRYETGGAIMHSHLSKGFFADVLYKEERNQLENDLLAL